MERLRAVSHGDESDHTNTVQLTSLIRNKGTESLSALPFDTLVQLVHFFSKQENQAHGLTTLPHIAQGIVLTENPSEALKTRTLSDLAVMASKFSMLSRHESCDAVMNLVAKEISRRLDHGAIPKGFTVQVLNTFAAAFTRSDSTTCRNASRFIASTVLQYLADDRTRSHLELSSLAGLASSFMHNANRESQCAQALDTILSLAQGLLEREDELVTVDVLMQLRDLCKSMRKHPMALALQDTINTRLQVREPISASGKRVRAADEPVEESDRKKRRTASPENPMNAGRKR